MRGLLYANRVVPEESYLLMIKLGSDVINALEKEKSLGYAGIQSDSSVVQALNLIIMATKIFRVYSRISYKLVLHLMSGQSAHLTRTRFDDSSLQA
jgi:hypothetical protein